MSNVIQFPSRGLDESSVEMQAGFALMREPAPHSHAVQFYDGEEYLFDTVARFLEAGLAAGDRLIVMATQPHRAGFTSRLPALDVERAIDSGQLVLLDARTTLDKFMVGDMPDPERFRSVINGLMTAPMKNAQSAQSSTTAEKAPPRVRAYGEMVDLLWRMGSSRAAIRLEELWNDAGKAHSFTLLCAYLMGNFYKEGDSEKFMQICRNHTHVLPTESFTNIDDSFARLREICFLQQRARALETEVRHRRELEHALRDALAERSRVEEELRACVAREREARTRAEASDAYKEIFVGVLGRDLRNPLNTVLTTARLMVLRGELPPESEKRLARMISSGVRMERMIEQLLDVTRARLAGGIPVVLDTPHDIVELARKIIEEVRTTHPDCTIDLQATGTCFADVDPDRFEQVISNLLGNAVAHGDRKRPITVTVHQRRDNACLEVHNYGKVIEAELVPMLFDPFARGHSPRENASGLGLGLYLVERIISAHGGKLQVHSSNAAGTTFEAIVPLSRQERGNGAAS